MSRTFTFTDWLYRGPTEREHEVEVTYSVTDFIPASWEQPAEGGEVEIVSVTHQGEPFATMPEEDAKLQERAEDRAQADWDDWAGGYDYDYE